VWVGEQVAASFALAHDAVTLNVNELIIILFDTDLNNVSMK
jgi:hypothetical protein